MTIRLHRLPAPRTTGAGGRVARRRATAMAVLLAVLAAGCGLGLSRLEVDTGVSSFLPSGAASLDDLEKLQKGFGGDPVVVLLSTQQENTLLSAEQLPRLLRLEGELAQLDDVSVVYGPATVFNQIVIRTQQLLARISGRRDGIRDTAVEQALARGATPLAAEAAGTAALADYDRRYGGLLAESLPAGLPTLRNPDFVQALAYGPTGASRPQYRFVLPSRRDVALLVRPREGLDQLAVDALSDRVRSTVEAAELPGTTVRVTGSPVLSASLADQVRTELPRLAVLALAVVGALIALLSRAPWRRRLVPLAVAAGATVLTLATLGLVGVPLSLGMLALLPIVLGVGNNFAVYLAQPARRRTVLVVGVASATSFATLALSPLPFVRGLGLSLALGVAFSLALGLLLPACDERNDAVTVAPPPTRSGGSLRLALVAAMLAAAAGWAVLPGLPVEASPQSAASGLPAVREAEQAEEVLGATGEVVVSLAADDVLSPESLAWSRAAHTALVTALGDRIRTIAGPALLFDFLGTKPTPEQVIAATDLLPPYLVGAVVRSDRREAVLSYGVRLGDLAVLSDLLDAVRAELPPPPAGARATLAGLPVVAVDGYDALSADRVLPNVLGVLAAALVLVIGLARRRDGVRALLAGAIAVGWGLLALRVLDVPLTPLTVSLGSLTAAIGCEFTVLTAEGQRLGRPQVQRGVLVAAATSTGGFLVLLASRLDLIRDFGFVLAGSVLCAYAASRLVVRALPPSAAPHVQDHDRGHVDVDNLTTAGAAL